jgi:hypothetical protein
MPIALNAVRKGGCVVCAGIHMSDIRSLGTASVAGTAGIGEDYADAGGPLPEFVMDQRRRRHSAIDQLTIR